MCKTTVIIITLAMLQGCARLGYESKYTVSTDAAAVSVAGKYYDAVNRSLAASADVAGKYADSCLETAKAISAPLAPAEAVSTRTKMAISGSGKEFDIVDSVPPENLLLLSRQRTKQVLALTSAMKETSRATSVPVAAPPGFISPCTQPWSDSPDLFNELPVEPPVEPVDAGFDLRQLPADDYSDVRDTAVQNGVIDE